MGASLWCGFTYWDDDVYVFRNALVTSPSVAALWRILTEPYYANYQPLHLLSYWIDRALWGLRPGPMHALNVALYAGGCALLHRVALRLPLPPAAATAAACLFAAHPAHVEPVAWISARKDCLMLPLLAGACLAWLRDTPRARLAALALGTAAALAKSQAMVLPGLLVALELWRRDGDTLRARLAPCAPRLLPFAAVSGLVALLAVAAQSAAGAVKVVAGGPLAHLGTTARAVAFDLKLIFAPWPLAAVYDLQPSAALGAPECAALVVLAFVCAVVVLAWRRRPRRALPLVAAVWAFAALLPVSGVVPLAVLAADRYVLLPSFGAALLVATGLQGALRARPRLFAALAAALVLAGAGASAARTRVWRDDLSLWRDTVARAPRSGLAWANYGAALADAADARGAVEALGQAERLRPGDPTVFANRVRLALALADPPLAPGAAPPPDALGAALHAAGEDPVALCALAQALARAGPGAAAAAGIVVERAVAHGAPSGCHHATSGSVTPAKPAPPAPATPTSAPAPPAGGSP
jgi:hypothetical protein